MASSHLEVSPLDRLRRIPPSVRPRWRRWTPAIVAVGALAIFVGILAYAYVLGGRGAGEGVVPVIQADQRPIKVRPESPGGLDVPFQDREIYDRLGGGGAGQMAAPGGPKVERLLPPPEAPLPRPATAPPPPTPPIPASPDVTPPHGAIAVPTPAMPKVVTTAPPVPPTASPVRPVTPPAPQERAAPAESSQAAPAAAPEPTPAQVAMAPAAGVSGTSVAGFRVQLAALKTEDEARRAAIKLQRQNGDLLGHLKMSVVRADLGAKGVFYRLQAGPLSGADAAGDLCAKLKARKLGCLVVRP